jgi:autoinducer 2-degrading protein
MYVVTVELEILQSYAEEFCSLMKSLSKLAVAEEPDCQRFDVCRSVSDPAKFFIYEVYDDIAAFEAHTQMEHTKTAAAAISQMIISKKAGKFILA